MTETPYEKAAWLARIINGNETLAGQAAEASIALRSDAHTAGELQRLEALKAIFTKEEN